MFGTGLIDRSGLRGDMLRRQVDEKTGLEYVVPRRLKRLRRGSALREGASIVASGTTAGQRSVAAGATEVFDIDIIEDCHLGRLLVQSPALDSLDVTAITVDNDGLENNVVPAGMYTADSVISPWFGHFVEKNSTIQVSVRNNSAAAALIGVGFTSLEANSR